MKEGKVDKTIACVRVDGEWIMPSRKLEYWGLSKSVLEQSKRLRVLFGGCSCEKIRVYLAQQVIQRPGHMSEAWNEATVNVAGSKERLILKLVSRIGGAAHQGKKALCSHKLAWQSYSGQGSRLF